MIIYKSWLIVTFSVLFNASFIRASTSNLLSSNSTVFKSDFVEGCFGKNREQHLSWGSLGWGRILHA